MADYLAVIQAGGRGSRMAELTRDEIPKPLLPLAGKPMLQWQVENIAASGIREFVIITGYLGGKIREYFADGSRFGVHISYIEEETPLGSAGALFYLKNRVKDRDIILVYGDIMFALDWKRLIRFHEGHNGLITVLVHPNSHPYDSDLLTMESDGLLTGIDPKNRERRCWYENCVNAGIFLLRKELMSCFDMPKAMDLEKELLLPLIRKRQAYGYYTTEYVKDAGTPQRFADVCREQRAGIWERRCLTNGQRCIFLDRDGTINRFRGLISDEEEFVLEETAAQAIREINESGCLAIVVTNQPAVARGLCDIRDMKQIHKKMQTLLGMQGAYLDDIIFCPHHPDRGYPGERAEYKMVCNCRKPKTGMIDEMAEKYHIDRSASWMIGDSTIDILTGIKAGLHTALVLTGQAGRDGKYAVRPDIVADNLLSAVRMILS